MGINPQGGDLHQFVLDLIIDTGYSNTDNILSLAKAIDKSQDEEYGYGTSVCDTSLTDPQVYGEIANLASAAFALGAIKLNKECIPYNSEPISMEEAIHSGWAYSIIHCGDFRSPEIREDKLKLVAIPFWFLPKEEQLKDKVAVQAVSQWRIKSLGGE